MRNIRSNHSGLAGWNLWFNNEWVMLKYEFRNRRTIEYPLHWKRKLWNTFKALIFGWTPHLMRRNKTHLRHKVGGDKFK